MSQTDRNTPRGLPQLPPTFGPTRPFGGAGRPVAGRPVAAAAPLQGGNIVEYTVLGRTGLQVSRIGLGGAFVASGATELADAERVIRGAIERGINYVDTAPMYGNSEEVIGKVLGGVPDNIVLSTKLGYYPEGFDPKNTSHLQQSFDRSRRLLGRDYVDVLIIHEPDRRRQFDWWDDWDTFTGPVLDFMTELKERGQVRWIGIGGTTTHELAKEIDTGVFDVVLTAFNYSLLWQEAALEVLPAAREHNVGVLAGSPLQQGGLVKVFDLDRETWLSLPRKQQYEELYRLVERCGIPLRELAMRFVASHSDIDVVLTGPRNEEQLNENINAVAKGPLSEEVLREIDTVYKMVPFRPFNEPFGLPFEREPRGVGPAV